MLRRLGALLLALAVLGVAGAVGLLGWAHVEIRRVQPELPEPTALRRLAQEGDLPVALHWVNTASQALPRRWVLDPRRDPAPDETGTVLSYPAFVLEWSDGRLLVVDVGMTPGAARSFGRSLELVGGSAVQAHGSLAERLGPAARRVGAVLFTHLHEDHTEGAAALCASAGRTLAWFRSRDQAERTNHTTRRGRRQLEEAGCLARRTLDGEAPIAVPGFPGVGLVPVAGHTPGSQVVLAVVREGAGTRRIALAGDVANHVDGIRLDLPKPFLYRWLLVPEADTQLGRARRFLRSLESGQGFSLALSHDQRQLEELGLPTFAP